MKRLILHAAFATLFAHQASAAVIFEQAPMPIGDPHMGAVGVASSDVDAIIQRSVAYDNFQLPEQRRLPESNGLAPTLTCSRRMAMTGEPLIS